MLTYKDAWKVVDFCEEQGYVTHKGTLRLEVVRSKKEIKNYPEHIHEDLQRVGGVSNIDPQSLISTIYLYPHQVAENVKAHGHNSKVVTAVTVQLLLHEMRHHVQRTELRNYGWELQQDYQLYHEHDRANDHWTEKDADAFSTNLLYDHATELAKLLKVQEERMQIYENRAHDAYSDFDRFKEQYKQIREKIIELNKQENA
ncbi:hypothetical protein [Geomicrobium sp. JCM 19038]|uniref:hypothetical protein n=1 Tax=Geomicrobium sp. JCM 19038 TaxID=1460635 RepID=UPI00045F3F5F|nr:hypothetical protein [Geomicrobium sp. JCM 19038]GAK09424.1 hypothetical protein JCM19038_3258 [Geomicrobium sp. JCM 19038]